MTVTTSHKSNSSNAWGEELLPMAPNQNKPIELPIEMTEEELADQETSWRSVFSFTTREHALTLTLSFALAAIVGIMKPAIAIFIGKVFNDLTDFGAGQISAADLISNVSKLCLYITVFGGISWILNGVFFSMWLGFGELQAKSAREKLFDSMLMKEMSWYDLRKEGIGALLSRIATQIRDLQLSASQPFGFIMGDLATFCAALGIAFYNSWKLTLVTLAGMPVAIVLLSFVSKQMKANIEAQKRDLTQASKFANTAIISIDTVKAYNGQEHEVWQYASAIKKAAGSYLRQANSNALQMGITRFVIISMFVQGFWFGISLADNGLSAGAVLTTFYACLIATESAETLLPQWLVIARGMSAGATLKAVLLHIKNGKKVVPMSGSSKPAICFGDIEVTNVSFAYPSNPHQLALDDTTFFFPAGETTFVIGQSGSGKSTLSNLLLKFYEPSSGDLSIDGESIQTLDATWLRQNITLVQQQSTLFNESMYQNIALGSLNPSEVSKEEIMAACQACMLQEVINDLPEGFDTYVGAGGNSMSGGQKQRVALARARLRDAPILILDEATSALDQISRALVMDAIREWRKGKTTIIITHDISQVLEKDFVYVLEHAKVVQEGYRRDLIRETHGPFASFAPSGPNVPVESSSDIVGSRPGIFVEDERISFADSYGSDFPDEPYHEAPSNFKRLSTLLGFQDKIALINNRRVSYGLSSAYANVVRVKDSIAKHGEAVVPSSRPQNEYRQLSYSDASWTESFPQERPLSSPARALGLRPQSITIAPNAKRNSTNYDEEADPRRWRLPSTIPSGIENDLRGRSGSAAVDNHRSSNAARMSGGMYLPVDEIIMSPRRFGHRFDRLSEKEPSEKRASKHKQKSATLAEILGTLWPILVWRDRLVLIAGFVFAFIHAAATPAFSYVLAKLLQVFYSTGNRSAQARTWSLVILAIAIVDAIATYFMHYLLEYCGQAWVNTLRVDALERILNQPRSWFDKEKNNVGRLNECLDRNAEEMRNLVGRFAGYVFVAVSMLSIALIWSLIISWKLTLIGLSSAPFVWGITRCFEYTSGKWEAKSNEAAELAHCTFSETFANIRIVRAFTLEKYFQDEYSAAILRTYKIGVKRATYAGIFFGLTDSSNLFVTALIFYYSALLAARNELSVTQLATVVNLLLFGIGNANAIMAFIPQISQSRVTATELLTLARLSDEASHESLGKTRIITPIPITLTSLSFTYPSRPTVQVLHNISMTFTAGSCTAIVGSSGSGKSTIASLILDLYPASSPSLRNGNSTIPPLTFSNYPITTLHTPTLRSHISIVPQLPVLFPTTVSANITYGLRSSSPYTQDSAIKQATKDADIHNFIMGLPNGYETVIGDGGIGLSGGQAQRIVIARALVRRPKVLLLDEATSALDGESADQIRATISRLVHSPSSRHVNYRDSGYDGLRMNTKGNGKQPEENEGMAVIIITHSIEMMRIAKEIVVVDAGRVVEVGAFEDLVARRGVFERLVGGVEYRRDLENVVEVASPVVSPLRRRL